MEKQTQAASVAAYVAGQDKPVHCVAVADALGIARPTVRRILGQGTLRGQYVRTAPGTYTIPAKV